MARRFAYTILLQTISVASDETFLIMRKQRRFIPDNPTINTDYSNPNFLYLKAGARVIVEKEWDGEIRFIGHCIIHSVESSPRQNASLPWRKEHVIKLKDFQPFIPPRMKNSRMRQMLKSIPSYYSGDSIRIIPREVYNAIVLACSTYGTHFEEEFEVPPEYDSIESVLNREESDTLEFKSTMCTVLDENKQILEIEKKLVVEKDDARKQEYKRAIEKRRRELPQLVEHAIVKTIAAFLNTNGGILIVGVKEGKDNTKTIVGIEADYPSLGQKKSWDGWRLRLNEWLSNYGINPGVIANNIHLRRDMKQEKTLARITVSPGQKETWITVNKDGRDEQHFYVRTSGQTDSLQGPDAFDYIQHRFKRG